MNKKTICFLIACLLAAPLAAQSADLPPWVILEQGRQEFSRQEYGKALELLKLALEVRAPYPEAEMLLGEIFMLEGEYELAVRQFRKVYDQKAALDTPADKYTALYRLTEIYRQREEYKNYEDTLQIILQEDPGYYRERWQQWQDRFLEVFIREGLDRFMILYRLEEPVVARAHGELGWFYYKLGRYDTSIIHSLFSLNIILSLTIEELRRQDPDYRFASLAGLLGRVFKQLDGVPLERIEAASVPDSPLRQWLLGEAALFERVYYLACALYAGGKRAPARDLWQIITPYGGTYGDLAGKQLANPWIESYLDVGSQRLEQYMQNQNQ